MTLSNFQRQLLGLDESTLLRRGALQLQKPVWLAFTLLAQAAAEDGFQLTIASAYRSYSRQLMIWNAKLSGERPVLDDTDREVNLSAMALADCVECVLRFSAMPGASRHHWGTDIDIFDVGAVAPGYAVQLSAAEVAANGPFAPLHEWLDQRIAQGHSFGFYRPYDRDRGGVAPERWHLSFAPLAAGYEQELNPDLLRAAWTDGSLGGLSAGHELLGRLEPLFERFVRQVAAPPESALAYLPPT